MKQLFIFLFKKILKSRLNIAIIILLTISLSVSFYFNSQTEQQLTLENRLETHIKENEKAIQKNEEKLSTMNDTLSDEYQFAKINLEKQKEQLKQRNQILSLLEQKNWKEAYFLQWKIEERNYEVASKEDYSSTELKVAINRQREVYKSLYPLNIKAHNLDFPTYGIDQIVWVSSAIIPTLFLISIIFLITQLFTDRYKDGLDTSILLPFSRVKYAICTLGVGLSYVSLLYIGLCIFSLLLGIFNNGFGRLDYPYPILDVVSQNVSIVKIQDILLDIGLNPIYDKDSFFIDKVQERIEKLNKQYDTKLDKILNIIILNYSFENLPVDTLARIMMATNKIITTMSKGLLSLLEEVS